MAHQVPLKYIFYIAATPEKVWEGFVSRESNRIIFSGAELQADFSQNDKASRATIELAPETEATKVTLTHDEWAEDDLTYAACADGWPRILSRLKTLLETGKTFKPH